MKDAWRFTTLSLGWGWKTCFRWRRRCERCTEMAEG